MGLYAYLEKPEKTFYKIGKKITENGTLYSLFKDLAYSHPCKKTINQSAKEYNFSVKEWKRRLDAVNHQKRLDGLQEIIYPLKYNEYYLLHNEVNAFGALHFDNDDIYDLFNGAILTTKKGVEFLYTALTEQKKEGFRYFMNQFIEGEHFIEIH